MGIRKDRLADEIRDILAVCFTAGTMQDPRLAQVTITAVKLSGDLQLASIYFRVHGDDDKRIKDASKGLESASGYLRKRLADGLDIRRVPTLRFFYDESIERGAHIESLLARLD